MKFSSVARVNSLFWITSLRESERGVTRRVLEDLEPYCAGIQMPFRCYEPSSAGELLAALDDIGAGAESSGVLPMVHFDMHGSTENGLWIESGNENVTWPVVADKLRRINLATGNNLCVVSAACFSFHVVRQIDLDLAAPFFILLAPPGEIAAGTLEDGTLGFYREMFDGLNILEAHRIWFQGHLDVFHCERMLAIILARYIDMACIGKHAERRKEQLLTMAFASGVANNRQNRRKLRKLAERQIEPKEDLIERFLERFLIGKSPSFSIADLKKFVSDARAAGIPPGKGPYSEPTSEGLFKPASR